MLRRVDLRAAQQQSKLRQVLEIVEGVSNKGENGYGSVSSEHNTSDESVYSAVSRNTSV